MVATSPPGVGLLKGLGVTIKHLFRAPSTQMYPKERPVLPPRTRGVIALMEENCTVCMLCARECPDWCIYIDSHKESVPPAKEGGRARTRNVLDRFAIDFALCMYCGICIEVCPFDALWWSPEFEYSDYRMSALLHEKDRLREWADTVPPPPPLDDGAVPPAEVVAAIEKANQERELEAAKQAQEAAQASAAASATTAPAAGRAAEPEIEVEAGQIDQETFDKLIAEGKSERIARSKAKAAWVKKEKARLKAEMAAAAPAGEAAAPPAGEAAAPAPKPAEIHVEAGQIDQETYDRLIAEGKTERMARAKAKAAYVKKEKARLVAERDAKTAGTSDATGQAAAPAPDAPARKLADVHVEGSGEIDQDVYDQLIAEGKSERIARSKAKAAWVKKRKQALLDEGGDA